jgi:hypothetical protein
MTTRINISPNVCYGTVEPLYPVSPLCYAPRLLVCYGRKWTKKPFLGPRTRVETLGSTFPARAE